MLELPLRLVLMRPQTPENVGAAARAMKNCGLRDWAWVDPAFEDLGPAQRLAVHAEELLVRAARPASLAQAVADCTWVVGTSSRSVRGKRRLSPREVAREAVDRARSGPVAIVFGDERSGLTNAEVDACHDLSSIPADDEQPSFNLAQAVLLYSYELRIAALEANPPPPRQLPVPANDALLRVLEQAIDEGFRAGGFLVNEGRHGLRDLVSTLRRAHLSKREAELWIAALKSVGKRG